MTEMLTASAPNSVWMPDAAPVRRSSRAGTSPGATMYSDRYEDTADEIVVQSARIFLGINYQCISCHGGKGFLEKVNLDLVAKKRRDLWAMAAFFGKTRVRIVPYQDRFTDHRRRHRLRHEGAELGPAAARGRPSAARRSC